MRKRFFSLFVIFLLIATCVLSCYRPAVAATQAAAEMKPAVVGSFSGYDALYADIETLGKVSGNPDLASGLEAMLKFATRSYGLAGLDKKKPWGMVGYENDSKISGYIFLPVNDAHQLLMVLEPMIGKPEDVGGGVLKTTIAGDMDGRSSLFMQQKGDWLIISKYQANLALSPEDPEKLLEDLPQEYDLAVRVEVANVSAAVREAFIARLKKEITNDNKRLSGETDDEYAQRMHAGNEILKAIDRFVDDLDQATLGWKLDNESGKAHVDLIVSAEPGSEMQKQLSGWQMSKTDFAGFQSADAALSVAAAGELTDAEVAFVKAVYKAVRVDALAAIEKHGKSQDRKDITKDMVDKLFDLLRDNVDSKRFDAAVSLSLSPDSATLLAGTHFPNAGKLEQIADIVASEHPEVRSLVSVNGNVDQSQGVQFHEIYLPIPDEIEHRDKITALVGEATKVVLGIGKDRIYLAAGHQALAKLKKAIADSVAERECQVPPLRVSLGLRSLSEWLAKTSTSDAERERAATRAAILADAKDHDHIILTAVAVENGLRLRLELESGFVKVAGVMIALLPANLLDR